MIPRQATSDDFPAILALIQETFAYMDGRIDPPSSQHRLTVGEIARQTQNGEVWVIGGPPLACMFLTPKPAALYLGKLAVAASMRGRGLAQALVRLAEDRARALRLPVVELQTRVELVENHAAFGAMGFRESARTSHPGYDRLTSLTMKKRIKDL